MENRTYKVNREDIYVGEVVRTTTPIYRYHGETTFLRTKPGQLDVGGWFSYRSMLFVPNEEKLSSDLLYQSPNYSILNVTDDATCLALNEESIVIKEACNLASLLEYFGYPETLTFDDVKNIRKTFFTGRFAQDHCELFGYIEEHPKDCAYYQNGDLVINPSELKRIIEKERRSQKAGHRSFSGIYDSVLSSEYFDVLDRMGDCTFLYAMKWLQKMNAFIPHKQEGPVKKLK